MKKTIPRNPSKNPHAVENAMRQFREQNDLALIARKLGRSRNVLIDKLNPDRESHKLCLLEAAALTELSGDMCLLEGFAAFCGLNLYEPLVSEPVSDSVISLVLKRSSKVGDFAGLYSRYMDDGRLDEDEVRDLITCLDDGVGIATKLRANLAQQLEDSGRGVA